VNTVISPHHTEPPDRPYHAIKGERRIVTFLFSDIKGSTALAEYLDPEEVLEIINGAFKILIDPVVKYEGTVARLMGDAILAFFGAPVSHEDDPARACRAALEIIEGAKAFSNTLRIEKGIENFDVRVGINTGLVVVGNVGAGQYFEYTALGDAINIAARMESTALPGTIQITEATKKHLQSDFQLESIGKLQLKGKTEPILTFKVNGFTSTNHSVRDEKLHSPMVGRARELKVLEDALNRLNGRTGGVVAIYGENGVGKSRLLTEAKELLPENIRWTECKAELYEMKNPYWLARNLIKNNAGIANSDSHDQIAHKLQKHLAGFDAQRGKKIFESLIDLIHIKTVVGAGHGGDALASGETNDRFHFSVKEYVKNQAQNSPLVLVCDNLQWSDLLSRDLLTDIIALTDEVPLLVLLAYRLEESERSFWEYHHRSIDVKDKGNVLIPLHSLNAADTFQLARNLLNVGEIPADLIKQIYDRTQGNALFVEEVLHSFLDRGVLKKDEGALVAQNYDKEFKVPDLLHNVLLSRIDSLTKIEKLTLQSASVIGKIFKEKLLAYIMREQVSDQELKKIIKNLQENELILRHLSSDLNNKILFDKEYIFKNPLIHDVVYSTFLKSDRQIMHKRIGEAIELLYKDNLDEFLQSLGYHFEQCREFDKAFLYHVRSGDRAAKYCANEDAIHFYTKAIAFGNELHLGNKQLAEVHDKITAIQSMFGFTRKK
jgi:class 3 adenylate cyclase